MSREQLDSAATIIAGTLTRTRTSAPPQISAACKLCSATATAIGWKTSSYSGQKYWFFRCPECRFAFVGDPWTDHAAIYDAAYYRGNGADPFVDYVFELEAPHDTVRQYEWRGILRAVKSLVPITASTKWLDYGCGNGALLRYCRENLGADFGIAGFDEGWIANQACEHGICLLSRAELDAIPSGSFDVITAIEVLEHIEWPLTALREIRRLLKPGGLFFFTTGNARPYRRNLLQWRYVNPDVHISYFEPETLWRALAACGFAPRRRGYLAGYTDIIRFKCLKSIGVRKRAMWERLLPWSVLSRIVDWRLGVTEHPLGWG